MTAHRRSSFRCVLLAAAALLVGATALAPAAGATPSQAAPAGGDDAAILDLVGCLQGSHRLAVVFLIDESKSLQLTDPDARRVDAAQAALSTLATLSQGSGDQRTSVDVTFAAFSNTYRTVRSWTSLRPATEPRLARSLSGFAKRDQGTDTDFVNALTGARRALASRSAALTADGGTAPCKAVLFFTDGEYDIAIRTSKDIARLGSSKPYAPGVGLDSQASVDQAEAAGRASLCDEGGLADGIRGDDITLLTVALAKDLKGDSQDLLHAATTGSSGATTCGKAVDSPPGSYLAADDVDLLIARFDEVAARVAGGTPLPSSSTPVLCGDDACPGGQRTANLDASVRRMRIFALAAKPGMTVRLDGPGGSTTVDQAGTSTVGPVSVTSSAVAGRGYTIDLDRPSGDGWAGPWKVSLLDPTGKQVGKPATLAIYLFSDFGIKLTGPGKFERGAKGTVKAELVAPKGVDAKALLAAGAATVRLEDPVKGTSATVELTGPPSGPFTATFTPPAGYRSSAYEASAELRATTKDGAAIVSRSAPSEVLVRRAGDSLQIAPGVLALPTITGAGSADVDLLLLGGKKGGCAWFGPSTASAPKEAGAMAVRYDGAEHADQAHCIPVAAGATVVVSVEVQPEHRATGAVRGVIQVHELATGSKATVTDVPYRLDLAVGIDQARRLVLAVLLLIAGIGGPMLLLLIINAVTARFQDLDAVQGTVVPVRVQGSELFRTDSGRPIPFTLRPTDFSSLRGAGSARRFAFGGVQFRSRAARNPFGATVAMAAPEGGAEKLKGRAGAKIELDPSLAGSWVFLLDPDRTRRAGKGAAEGNLIAFLAEGEERPQLDRLLPDLGRRLPNTAASLAGLVRSKKAKPAKASKAAGDPAPVEPTDAPDDPGAPDGNEVDEV